MWAEEEKAIFQSGSQEHGRQVCCSKAPSQCVSRGCALSGLTASWVIQSNGHGISFGSAATAGSGGRSISFGWSTSRHQGETL